QRGACQKRGRGKDPVSRERKGPSMAAASLSDHPHFAHASRAAVRAVVQRDPPLLQEPAWKAF
ncbi:MAG: hypothetical protein V2A73_00585, partial [Pseudomonadota bacterium]